MACSHTHTCFAAKSALTCDRNRCWSQFRNVLVSPLKLRTSPLGCPVSSLLGTPKAEQPTRCGGRFPVIRQQASWQDASPLKPPQVYAPASLPGVVSPGSGSRGTTSGSEGTAAQLYTTQVVLGANDKHLNFRTAVMVRFLLSPGTGGRLSCLLSDRVATHNAFGAFYMTTIAAAHSGVIAPGMLHAAFKNASGAIGAVWSGARPVEAALLANNSAAPSLPPQSS